MLKQIDCHGFSEVCESGEIPEDRFLIADLNKSLRVHQTSLGFDEQTRLFGGAQGRIMMVVECPEDPSSSSRSRTVLFDGVIDYILTRLRWFFTTDEAAEEQLLADLKAAIEQGRLPLCAEDERETGNPDRRFSLTLAYVIWPRLHVVHMGDSGCYLWRQGRLERIAQNGSLDLRLGDTLVLCNEELAKYVSDEQMALLLKRGLMARGLSHCLAAAAIENGAQGNLTVVAARFPEGCEEAAPADTVEALASQVG